MRDIRKKFWKYLFKVSSRKTFQKLKIQKSEKSGKKKEKLILKILFKIRKKFNFLNGEEKLVPIGKKEKKRFETWESSGQFVEQEAHA